MTQPSEDKYSIKLSRGETSASGSPQGETLVEVRSRIEDQGLLDKVVERPDRLGTDSRTAAEQIVDSNRINREGFEEIYLAVDDPAASSCPSHFPGT